MDTTKTNITTTVSMPMHERLEYQAAMAGLSLSQYVAGVLAEAVIPGGTSGNIRKVRSQHGSAAITIPPDICEHLNIEPGHHLSFVPVLRAALIRPVR